MFVDYADLFALTEAKLFHLVTEFGRFYGRKNLLGNATKSKRNECAREQKSRKIEVEPKDEVLEKIKICVLPLLLRKLKLIG